MSKELLLSSAVAATWLTLSFLSFGVLYGLASAVLGPFTLMAWENALGQVELLQGVTIGRLAVWFYGLAMFASVLPINYYWLRRERRTGE